MKHFAKLDDNDKVIDVVCLHDEIAPTEQAGIDFLIETHGYKNWKQSLFEVDETRKNPAGVGMQYDSVKDAFIHEKTYSSWVLNDDTCQWEAPTAKPDDGKSYDWDEASKAWVELYT